jgi:hypothetical protein
VRTTLTLDDDVAAKLRAEARRSGRPFRDIVNEASRHGLASRRAGALREPFKLVARDLGELRPGLSLDDVAALLDEAEGPLRRWSSSTRISCSTPTTRGRSSTRPAGHGWKRRSRDRNSSGSRG